MADETTLEEARRRFNEVSDRVRSDGFNWSEFLTCAARNHKYDFRDQLLIYDQRPNAVACADIDLWNKHFSRYVNKGTKSVRLLSPDGQKVRHVFDIADTRPGFGHEFDDPPYIWQVEPEDVNDVSAQLNKLYGVSGDLRNQIAGIARTLSQSLEASNDALYSRTQNSSEREKVTGLLRDSVEYYLLTRCGLEPYVEKYDFEKISELDKATVMRLGTVTSGLSRRVLDNVEQVVRGNYERRQAYEEERLSGWSIGSELHDEQGIDRSGRPGVRGSSDEAGGRPDNISRGGIDGGRQGGLAGGQSDEGDGGRNDLRESSGHLDPVPNGETETAAAATDEVRENEAEISGGMESSDSPRIGRGSADSLLGDTGTGESDEKRVNGTAREPEPAARQGKRPAGVGTTHEQSGHGGGRSSNDQSNIQLDDRYYLDDGNSPKNKFIEAHSYATAMLRVPGFLNSQTKGADLFNPKQEVQVIFNSGITYITSEVARKIHLSVWEIEQYRDAKEWARGYLHKKISSPVSCVRIIFARKFHKEGGEEMINNFNTEIIETALQKHHKPREQNTFIYVKRKNIEKRSRTDRQCFYDSYAVSELERFLRRTNINDCDFWATAAEYTWGFRKIKEKKILRTKENGERYEEIRRQLPKREKWIEAIQLNFLHLNFRKSELGYIPTIEQVKELIYARCEELNLPKPAIIDTGDNGETLELRWTWQNAMKNCGERDDMSIKFPKFNGQFDAIQSELFSLFWDFGVDDKKLSATSMLCVVGTPNTKTGKIRSVACEADEILTYQEFAKRLGLNFGEAHDEREEASKVNQPEQSEVKERDPLAVAETMSRAMEILEPESSFTKFASELSKYVDFEILMVKKNSQSHQVSNLQEEHDDSQAEAKEIKVPQVQEDKSCQPLTKIEEITGDLSRLHSDSNYWVCLCTENKASKGERGKWTEYWTPANRVLEALSTLKLKLTDFDEFNIYVSQLEFSEQARKVENVAAFRACFVDIDGKIAGGELSAEEWKNLILKFCNEKKIPIPSEMVFSGNGVHVKYFFNKLMTKSEFSRWERLERKLAELFKEIGADSHATDGARVLRVEGTKNCKPDTKDREVRVIFTGENYDFEKFACEIETLLPDEIQISEPTRSSKTSLESDKPNSGQKTEKPRSKETEEKSESSQTARQPSDEEQALSTFEDWEEACKTWFYLLNATTGSEEWVSKSDLNDYLKKQDKTHRLKCSIVEYTRKQRQDRPKFIENIYFSHVVLTKCPSKTLEEQIAKIREHCREYRGVGIPEPNRILEDGNKLILIWRYSKEPSGQELPGCALPRWKVTQECLSHYFYDFGVMNFSFAQKSTMLLPLSGFSLVKVVYENPELKYLFDTIATAVLPFSQEEVKSHESEKEARPRRSITLEPLTAEYVSRREAEGRKSRFNPALKIFNDIVRLLSIRALNGVNEEVPEGRRELSVFYALNFAVQAGLVKEGTENFNELAQRLINFCGKSFTFDCDPDTMTTLRNKFALGKEVYRPKKKTLIYRLEITAEEQTELEILKLDAPEASKSEKRKKIPEWEILGVSKSTYYSREERAKKIAAKLREIYSQYFSLLWIANEISKQEAFLKLSIQMRLKKLCIL